MMDVSEMPAGREMDCLIDEKIFGNDWTHIAPDMPWDDIAEYSTDIAAAWQVVEKMVSEKEHFEFYYLSGMDKRNYFARFWWMSSSAVAETAPLAICRAALLAIEGDKE